MTKEEKAEHQEILRAVDEAKLDAGKFLDWVDGQQFPLAGREKYGWQFFGARHGRLGFAPGRLQNGMGIAFCYYAPNSTKNQSVPVVIRGTSASAVTLPKSDLQRLFSSEAIENRVTFVCAMEAEPMEWAAEDVTPVTTVADELLSTDDEDDVAIEGFLGRVFDEVRLWFDFDDSPEMRKAVDVYPTVGDIIRHVQGTFRG